MSESATERQLAEANERYRSFVANSSEGIWRCELDESIDITLPPREQIDLIFARGYLAECNDAMARMYGYEKAEDITGARLTDLMPPENPENIAYLEAFIRAGYRLRETESVEKDREGGLKYFSNSLTGVIEKGFVLRAWGTQRDVTEQREAAAAAASRSELIAAANDLFVQSLDYEQTLRNLAVLAVPRLADWCAVDIIDDDGSARRLAVEHLDAEKVKDVYALEEKYPSKPDASRGLPLVLRTGKTDWLPVIPSEMLEGVAQSDEHLQMIRGLRLRSYICAPIRAGERILGVLTLVNTRDSRIYTEADVFLAEQLAVRAGYAIENARLYAQALEANRAKDDFLATLSHELRTPLTAILGWANLLRLSSYDPAMVRGAVDTIEKSAKAQAALIDDILDVSRIVTGKFALQIASMDLVTIVENVLALARPTAQAKRITIAADLPESLPLQADANRVQQIVWNLVSNALKFSKEGGRIDVSVSRKSDEAVIRVRDRGVGIDARMLPRVFDRFWQADSSTHRLQGGLGLGLAIVKHLTELHGGTVHADSDGRDKGSTFTIALPVVRPHVGESMTATPDTARRARVLLVDDDDAARMIISRTLEHFGAAVTPAASADEALQRLELADYDLLLTDIAMPGHDGYWLLSQSRKRRPHLRVAAITALGPPDEHFMRNGFDACVRKPVNPDDLATLLNA
jgi:PAS domain S-box-containing protein